MIITPFCQRCGGKMYHMRDLYGEYDDCMNCGYHRDILVEPLVELKTPWRGKELGTKPKRPLVRRSHGL